MCARFSLSDPGRLSERYPGVRSRTPYPRRYNIAPTQDVLAARADGELTTLRWGLVPAWADDPSIGQRLINARVETLAEKPAFRGALESRRCAIFADGFYEWTGSKGNRRPLRFILADGAPFAFAGLYERWKRNDTRLETCTIVTCEPNALLASIHDRMPAILAGDALDAWLHGDVGDALAAIAPFDPAAMRGYSVTPAMNHHAFEDARCIEPFVEQAEAPTLFD
ncbi:SOS response-associated peptidase [Vulcanimicrobium alpinum]|nr:SOS response-associated peptidase [Vulcanimicrobium alpinum]